jgi:2-methylcitrate dehydratase PrpD
VGLGLSAKIAKTQDAGATRRLLDFALTTPAEALPPDIRLYARAQLADCVAVALSATEADGMDALRAVARAWGGVGQAGVIGSRRRAPAPIAALINGAMMHALDFDDTHAAAYVHPGAAIVPAAMAAANRRGAVDGEEFLAATALATEVMCRLGLAFPGTEKSTSGWHFTPLLGHLAATLAAARVARLPVEQAAHALGIAYHQTAGNMQGLIDGALTKRIGPGLAAQHAVVSVALAEQGLTGARDVLEGRFGLFRQYGRDAPDAAVLRDGLGERFESRDVFIKPFPCCALVHPFIEAALAMRLDGLLDPQAITAIEARRGPGADLVCEPAANKQHPRNVVDAQFSAGWGVAAALVFGRVGLDAYTPQALRQDELVRLSGLVTTPIDGRLARQAGLEPVELTVTLRDGVQRRAMSGEGQAAAATHWRAAAGKLEHHAFGGEIASLIMAADGFDLAALGRLIFRPAPRRRV